MILGQDILWLIVIFPIAWILQKTALTLLDKVFHRRQLLAPDRSSFEFLDPSLFFVLSVVGLNSAIPFFDLADRGMVKLEGHLYHAVELLHIVVWTWLLIKCVSLVKALLFFQLHEELPNNLHARKIRTQFEYLEKFLIVGLFGIGLAMSLMTFESVRKVGSSLIASAGLAGVVFGFAAQKALANLVAGLQIAFTQPIRIDDVVIVESEWGRVEEITLTYVVLKLWDLRRLIVPITYFTEKPFQNWTRSEADILGYVFLYLDYGVPLDELRAEFQRVLENAAQWDRKVAALQVTDQTDHNIQIRLLMSSPSAGDSWDLRCLVREKLTQYLQRNYPTSFSRWRIEGAQTSGPDPAPPGSPPGVVTAQTELT